MQEEVVIDHSQHETNAVRLAQEANPAPSGPGSSSPERVFNITDKQRAAIAYMVTTPSLNQGAERAGVSRATFYRWLDDPEFKAALQAERTRFYRQLISEQDRLMLSSMDVIAESLNSEDPAIRLRAARMVWDYGTKVQRVEALAERVKIIENFINDLAEEEADADGDGDGQQ